MVIGSHLKTGHLAEEILTLSLKIICLLTGQDYIIVRKHGDRIPHESDGTQSPSPVPPPHSATHERNREQKILELTNKMMSLLTGEVPVRCDDVTVYFSMEEWEYLEGHKELYRDVMMETHQPRSSPDASEVRDRAPNSPLDSKTSRFIKEESASCEETDICDPAESPQTELTSTRNEDGSPSDEDGNVSAPDTHTEHDGGDKTPVHVKEESASCEETDICDPAEPPQTELTLTRNEDGSPSDEDGNVSAPDTHIDLEGVDYMSVYVKEEYISDVCCIAANPKESTSTDAPQTSNTHFQCETPPDEGTYSCPEHQERFTSDSDLLQHQTIHDRSAASTLDGGKSSHSKSKRIRHQRGEKPYSCSECGKCFISNWHLVQHFRVHTGEKPYICSECGKCFKGNADLLRHLRIHTGEKPFSCSDCGKRFKQRTHFLRHQQTHTGEKPFPCSECEKCFTSNFHLVQHFRTHTGEKPFSCSECGKSFGSNWLLGQHLRIHTGENPYLCSECGRCFKQKSHYVVHQRTHTGEKPFPCSECGKSFGSNRELIRHLRIHTGEKPYSCSECGKCFKQKSHIVAHQRSHTGEKTFLCSICGKSFISNCHLAQHLRIHTGEKPYSCSECGKCFKQKSHIVAHQRTHTGEK